MELQVLGSSSAANCYALHAGGSVLLLDAGVSIQRIMREVGNWRGIAGCVITHEHGDHSKSAAALALMGVEVVMSAGTAAAITFAGGLTPFNMPESLCTIRLGNYTILPFDTQHDAIQPYGYVVRYEPTGETLLYATDTYYLKHTFPGIHYWIAECNYIDDVVNDQVDGGEVSPALRQRLKKSHMSLRRLVDALKSNDLRKTRAIVLVHLSDERSNERAMIQTIKEVTGIEEVSVATAGSTIPLQLSPF